MPLKEKEQLAELKENLNKTGCGFCAAKWTQVTIHLQVGETHSCHHPTTHKVPVQEVLRNPSALHNTKHKKKRRKEMLEGQRPAECDYCWNVEDNSSEFSDRIYKSNEPWSKPYIEEIRNLGWSADFNPKYVEVAWSNACNFKCSYCSPTYSTSWLKELKEHGPLPTTDGFNDINYLKEAGKIPFDPKEYNPYVEAFWKWWPDLYRDLHTFRMTGGEPLMAGDTWRVLDYIIDNPNPNRNLKLGINSNLGVSDNLVDKLIEKAKILEENGLVKELVIYTSCDTKGAHAEYPRTGLDYDKWLSNVHKILGSTRRVSMVCMSTFNLFSVPRYQEFLADMYDVKKKHNNPDRYWAPSMMVDSSYLRHPQSQAVQILPEHWADVVEEAADFADNLRMVNKAPEVEWEPQHIGFTDIEVSKIKRIADWMRAPKKQEEMDFFKANFYRYVNAHDERRGTNFLEVFPELSDFYFECEELAEQ